MIIQNSNQLLKAAFRGKKKKNEEKECRIYKTYHQSDKERKNKTHPPWKANGDKDPR